MAATTKFVSRRVTFEFLDENGGSINVVIDNGRSYNATAQAQYSNSSFGNKDIRRIAQQILAENVLANDDGAKAVKLTNVFITETNGVLDWST